MNRRIEIFRTNVTMESEAREIISLLQDHFPQSKINFDLHDCDKILRVEGELFVVEDVMTLVKENGYECDQLD